MPTVAATIWGGYGRFVSNPMVAAIISVVVVATNIGLILGSRLWDVPLATDINKLWIDPASQVASNNKVVDEFGSKVTAQNNELFTLGDSNNGNMLTPENFGRWANLTQRVLDTVVFYNGTAYTILDICNGKNGQVPYSFGCSWNNPLDYFREGKDFFPTDAVAQWLIEEKLFWRFVNPPAFLGATTVAVSKGTAWAWAINADTASGGAVSFYTNWFTARCLETAKVLCVANPNILVEQVNNLTLLQAPFPLIARLQFMWIKAQLVTAAVISKSALPPVPPYNGDGVGTCSGDGGDAQTTTNTDPLIFTDPTLLVTMAHLGVKNGSVHSWFNCSAQANTGAPCTGSTCTLLTLQKLKPLEFSGDNGISCASCVWATMWWMGEFDKIQPGLKPLAPAASGLLSITKYPISFTSVANNFAAGAVLKGQNCTETEIPASNCTALWQGFYDTTTRGLQGDLEFVAANNKARGLTLGRLPIRPDTELLAYNPGLTQTTLDATWRSLLKSGAIPPVKAALLRFDARPSYKALDTDSIARVLSGFDNDLLTQNLRSAVFGGATPNPRAIRAGRCQCTTTPVAYAGLQCNIKADDICECDTSLKPACIGVLLKSCVSMATCAGFPTIVNLVGAVTAGLLTVPPEQASQLAAFQNFANETMAASGFFAPGLAPLISAGGLLSQCQKYLPCLDNLTVTDNPQIAAMVPVNYRPVIADGMWNLATVQDLSSVPRSYFSRATILMGSLLQAAQVDPSGTLSLLNTLSFSAEKAFDITDFSGAGTCYGTAQDFNKCLSEANGQFQVAPVAPLLDDLTNTSCPITFTALRAQGITKLTLGGFFACFTEVQQATLFSARSGLVQTTFWPKGDPTKGKGALCAQATAAPVPGGNMDKQKCLVALSSLLIQGIGQIVTPVAAVSPTNAVTMLQAVFSVTDGTQSIPYAQSSLLSQYFANAVGSSPNFVTYILTNVYGGCSGYFGTQAGCATLRTTVNNVLGNACVGATNNFVVTGSMYADSCGILMVNLGQSLPGPTQNAASVAAVSRALAKYKFMGTIFGACSATGGGANGGGECWKNEDCNSVKGQGTCNLTDVSPLKDVRVLASIAFTNDGEGTVNAMKKSDARFRERANAPILARYQARANQLAGRRLAPIDFGTLGPVTDLSVDNAKEIIALWRKEMINNVAEFRDEYPTARADVVSADSASDLLNEISEADPKILVLGYGLMLLYTFLSCTNWSTDVPAMLNGSRALVGQIGVILVAISVASGLGVSHLAGVEWSAAATQIIPFVMLGLGVSDTFVLLRIFPYYQDGLSPSEACAKALTIAGPPMLLVSATNAGVFAVGVLTAMPVVVNFALQAVIVVIANYITTNLMLPALLVIDYKRMAAGRMDMAPCIHVGTSHRAQVNSETSEYETNVFNRFLTPCYATCLLSIPGKLFIICLSVAFLGSAIYGEERVAELGLQLSDVAPAGSDLANALITRDTYLGFYVLNVATPETDWSLRESQQGLVKIFNDVMASEKVVDASGTPWIQVMMSWGQVQTPTYDPFAADQLCNETNPRTEGKCGLKVTPNPCTVITADDSVVNGSIPYFPKADFYRCLKEWINSDIAYEALKPGFKLKDEFATKGNRELFFSRNDSTGLYIPYTTGSLITQGLNTNADFVQLINEVRAVANSQTVPPSFPYGEPIDFWDQYVSLREIINRAVGYGLLICFVTIWFLLVCLVEGDSSIVKRVFATFWASALTTGIIALTVYEIYGYMAWAGLKISAIPAISIIMSTGVAVEYTAYLAVVFVNGVGTGNERARHSLMLMLAPVIDGAVTMFLGVVMLAASPFVFIVKYFFYPWLFIIFFGMFNGIAFLPVLFSLVGPPAVMSAAGKKTVDSKGELATKA